MTNRAHRRGSVSVLIVVFLVIAQFASAEVRGIIEGESIDLRAEKNAAAAVVATVKPGESFSFDPDGKAEWCEVTLGAGKKGWLPFNRVRLFYDAKDLPKKDLVAFSQQRSSGRQPGEKN